MEYVVRDFLRTREPHLDLELADLVQECLLHWWCQRPRYKAGRGASMETFLRRVVTAKLLDLDRGVKAKKRGGGRAAVSLDQPLSEEPDSQTLADVLPDQADTVREATDRVSLEMALSRLSPQQRQIIAGLEAGYPKSRISQSLGIPRPTLYDDLNRIRQIFKDEGLNQILDGSDS